MIMEGEAKVEGMMEVITKDMEVGMEARVVGELKVECHRLFSHA